MVLSSSLPPYRGPYQVGFCDVEVPVAKEVVGDAILKESGEAALTLSTVLFTLYYPTTPPRSSFPWLGWHAVHPPWLSATVAQSAQGYAAFARKNPWIIGLATRLVGGRLRLSAWLGGELAPSLAGAEGGKEQGAGVASSGAQVGHAGASGDTLVGEAGEPKAAGSFPLVVFSHGLAGTRTTYSQYCGELASQGYIVAALEHRDGSAPITLIDGADGRSLTYTNPDAVESPAGQPALDALAFRSQQLLLRLKEVKAVLDIMGKVNAGWGEEVERANLREGAHGKGAKPLHLARWVGRVGLGEELTMAGHSFGGATTLQVLRAGRDEFAFTRGIALDPWVEPIPAPTTQAAQSAAASRGGAKDAAPTDINVPLLVLNSEQFTIWSSHFATVRKTVKSITAAPAWLLTCLSTKHMAFSDFLLLSWLATKFNPSEADPKKALQAMADVSLDFLARTAPGGAGGARDEGSVLGRGVDGDGGVSRGELEKRKLEGVAGGWRVSERPE